MSDYFIVPTGKIIKEYLEQYQISQKNLSSRLGISEKHISNLLNGKSRLTEEVAIQLENIFTNIPASYWLNYECKYREFLMRESLKNNLSSLNLNEIARRFKFKEVFSGLDWSIEKQALEMLKLLGISDYANFESTYSELTANFMEDGGELESIVIWLNLCSEEAEIQNVISDDTTFNQKDFRKKLALFKQLAQSDSPDAILKNARKLLNSSGVYLVVYPAITNCKVRGALTTYKGKPAIYLSGRFKTHDHIWFALMHEIGHLLLHFNLRDTLISYDDDADIDSNVKLKEEEANSFARDFFIDSTIYSNFINLNDFSEKNIRQLAVSQKILPGIAVARLQHDRHLPNSKLNHLKSKINLYE